jgi:hypothetical protein
LEDHWSSNLLHFALSYRGINMKPAQKIPRARDVKTKFHVSVNRSLVNKPRPDTMGKFSANGWEASLLTEDELIGEICQGFAFAPQYRDGHRSSADFVQAGFVAADFDGSKTLNEARDNAFINSHASFIYTTASHTNEEHHFRVVFVLDEPVVDGRVWADALFGLAHKLGSDPTVGDAARCFFGSANAATWKMGHTLSSEDFEQLAVYGADLRSAKSHGFSINSTQKLASDFIVNLADGSSAPLSSIAMHTSVHCPYHDDQHASAFIVPSWTRGGIGIHCRSCATTYWQVNGDQYDFNAFDKMVERRLAKPEEFLGDPQGLEAFFPPKPKVTVHRSRYLPTVIYEPGITLIKSPKGTGKTEMLKNIFGNLSRGVYKQGIPWNEKVESVLLIGHRRALLREAAAKLKLTYYRDMPDQFFLNPKTLAVCLDSLPMFSEPYTYARDGRNAKYKQDPAYDLVVIDESEQVFSHLTGGTIAKKRGGMERCFDSLRYEVANAKAVIALDADLGMLTCHALQYLRPQDWQSRTRIIVNNPVEPERKRTLQLYSSEIALREELLRTIANGDRCFVACNSKRIAKVLAQIISKKFSGKIKLRIITSDNSRDSSEIEFVSNIRAEFLKIQVLICSPSLGTGIDITFPDCENNIPGGLCKVDHVFGFFYPKVNTHTDMDQQLSRVRNPGSVKVWISPARFEFSSNFDVIRDDLARAYFVPQAVKGRTEDGLINYDPVHPLLMICTHITASQRASKNNLIELFSQLRVAQGWNIERVTTTVKANKDRSEAERALWKHHVKSLLHSPTLDDHEYLDLSIRMSSAEPVPLKDRLTYEKNTLQRALGVPLTYEIITLNHDGHLLERVETLAHLTTSWSDLFGYAVRALADQSQPLDRLSQTKGGRLIATVLQAAGVSDASGIRRDALATAGSMLPFIELCSRNTTVLEEILGQAVRKDVADNPIRQLNAFLKLAGLKLELVARRKAKAKSVRSYGFKAERFDLMHALASVYRSPKEIKESLEEAREAA